MSMSATPPQIGGQPSHLGPGWQWRFWVIFGAQAASLIGSALTQFVLIWWITDTKGSVSALAGLFLPATSEAVPIGQHVVRVSTRGFVAFGVAMVLFGTVRANGQVIWPVLILILSLYPICIGFALRTRDWLGIDALWLSFPATLVMALALYLHGGWRRAPVLRVDTLAPAEFAANAQTMPAGSAQTPQIGHGSRA